MMERAAAILEWLVSLPEWLLYLLVGAAAAIENLLPPFPADVIVVIGGVIAGAGRGDPFGLLLAVWSGNVGSALLVYWLGHRYGAGFFHGRLGRILLSPPQVQALERAYRRFGFPIIFFSRFLPVFRPIVPVFAGVARLGFWKTAPPLALASAIWYGFLVYIGSVAGANWRPVLLTLSEFGGWMWVVAFILVLMGAVWWHRTRRKGPFKKPME